MTMPLHATRNRNMQRRRERILDQARVLIGQQGFEGLTLRELALAAQVTVPTIYNLIGNKNQILRELNDEMMERLEGVLAANDYESPLAMAEAIVFESTALFATDPDFYRATVIASAYVDEARPHNQTLGRRSARLPTQVCQAGVDAGVLRGKIAPDVLGEQIYRSYRTACRDWASRRITLEQFRANGLLAVYLTLAADAVDTFHCRLVRKIVALSGANGTQPVADDQGIAAQSVTG